MVDGGTPGDVPRQDQLLEEASLWFARMRGPDAEAYRADFEAWLALGYSHLGAYNRAGEIFALGKFLAEAPTGSAGDEGWERHHNPSRWRGFAIVASILIVFGVSAWLGRDTLSRTFGDPPQVAAAPVAELPAGEKLSTIGAERRKFTLDDGSTVTLDRDSLLATAFDSRRRELSLERGRARFEVAHEPRPFVVLAGGGSVTARGTIFDVILSRDDGVTVRLLRGAVDVVRPSTGSRVTGGKEAVTRLSPGEELSFGSSAVPDLGSTTKVREEIAVASLPPIPAAREYDMAPLSEVIAEANRGSSISIRVDDPAVGALRVSGRFRVDNPDRVADRLASLFDLEVDRSHPNEIVLRSQ